MVPYTTAAFASTCVWFDPVPLYWSSILKAMQKDTLKAKLPELMLELTGWYSTH